MRHLPLADRIRALAWSAPVLVLGTPGCTVHSSCSGFKSELVEERITLGADAGPADLAALSTPEGCGDFCSAHGVYGESCRAEPSGDDTIVVCSFNTVCEGRRPDGWAPTPADRAAPLLGRYFATMASTEAASVAAFERMAEELERFGAPSLLVERARTAATEERRHVRMTAALARRYGATALTTNVPRLPRTRRDLSDFATENAREGVVRETLGAALGHWQARHASEATIRRSLGRIADDETGHAVLSHDVDAWARTRLPPALRARLETATRTAIDDLDRALDAPVPSELVERAGVPTRRVAKSMLRAARDQLWP